MRSHLKLVLFLLAFLPSLPQYANAAEVWKCGKTYTSNPEKHKNCVAIDGSKVCGSEGNKYFAPRRMSGSTDDPCPVTGRSKSPFVDLESLAAAKARKGISDQNNVAERDIPIQDKPN